MKTGEKYTIAELTELTSRVINFINEDLVGGPVPLGIMRFIGNEIVLFAEAQLMKEYLNVMLKQKQKIDDLQEIVRQSGGAASVDRI